MNTIGINIKSLRQKNSYTQGDIAKALNISIPAFSKIETGVTDPNMSRIHQISDFFGVDVSELINEGGKGITLEIKELTEGLTHQLSEAKTEIVRLQGKVIELYEKLDNRESWVTLNNP